MGQKSSRVFVCLSRGGNNDKTKTIRHNQREFLRCTSRNLIHSQNDFQVSNLGQDRRFSKPLSVLSLTCINGKNINRTIKRLSERQTAWFGKGTIEVITTVAYLYLVDSN